jgi:hypothetical protein
MAAAPLKYCASPWWSKPRDAAMVRRRGIWVFNLGQLKRRKKPNDAVGRFAPVDQQ